MTASMLRRTICSRSYVRTIFNLQLAARMREARALCEGHGDVATTSLIETWIDQAEKRIRSLFEVSWQAREFG